MKWDRQVASLESQIRSQLPIQWLLCGSWSIRYPLPHGMGRGILVGTILLPPPLPGTGKGSLEGTLSPPGFPSFPTLSLLAAFVCDFLCFQIHFTQKRDLWAAQ